MRVIFMGTPDFAVPVLEGLIDNCDVILVVSQPDRKVGRKQELLMTPIKKLASSHNICVFQPVKIKEDYQKIVDLEPDLIVTCAYGQIIPKVILDCPKLGCINVHASLLPKLRGGAPIHKALIDDYHETGITIMYMDEKMDNGDIISQRKIQILDSDNLESLHDKLSIMGRDLLLDTLPSIIDGSNDRIKQDEDEVTYAYNIKREEEHIDFSRKARDVFNLVRGLFPVPCANALLFGEEMKILSCLEYHKKYDGVCGEIVEITKEGIVVVCGDSSVLITKIKPFGKKMMEASSYVNGVGKDKLIGQVFK